MRSSSCYIYSGAHCSYSGVELCVNGLSIAIEEQAICSSQMIGDLVCVVPPSYYPSSLSVDGLLIVGTL